MSELSSGICVQCINMKLNMHVFVLCISVPLSPKSLSCVLPTTSSVRVEISPPDGSASFSIDFYEVTYKSVVERFPKTAVHRVSRNDDALTEADAGVTYNISVVSRSGQLTSHAVMTTCTAGQFGLFIQRNMSSLMCTQN